MRRESTAGKQSGRTQEIQRLIGRSLRAVADLEALGPQSIVVDCDVLQADGGTRTASITGGFIALVDAIASIKKELPDPSVYPLRDSIAAISVGIVDGKAVADCYAGFQFEHDEVSVEATVFPVDGIRQAPISPINGKPMQRADEKAVRALLEPATRAIS